jgi:hypothetical protein
MSITSVVGFFTTKPTKLSLYFSVFSTIFYAFYKFQQIGYIIEVAVLHWGPWKDSALYNVALGHSRRRREAKFRRGSAEAQPGNSWGGARAHLGLICAGVGGREAAGGGGRRHLAETAAGALAPARRLPGWVRGQDGEQQQGQERVEGTTVGARGRWNLGSPRRSSLAPADGSDRGGRASVDG